MLKSDRIQLVSITESDISQEYLNTLNDSNYLKFSRNSSLLHDKFTQAKYIFEINASNNLFFGIKTVSETELVGTVNCFIDFQQMTLNLGFLIFRKHANKGYATETLEIFLAYLSHEFPGMTVVIGASIQNMAMQKVAKKFDFELSHDLEENYDSYIRFIKKIPKLNSSSIPFVPQYILNAKKIGIAANDAGGAEQVAWLLKNLNQYASAYISGPAIKVFEQVQVNIENIRNLNHLNESNLIITGSGWMSNLEKESIKFANKKKITCVTILDNWVNYLTRFSGDPEFIPMILAVTNHHALLKAHQLFPDKLVWLLPDFQLMHYQNSISRNKVTCSDVLVISEPIFSENPNSDVSIEDLERLIVSAISLKDESALKNVTVRAHPSQVDNTFFSQILEKFPGEISVSYGTTLLDDLKKSKIVIGINSYALYISAMCGIKTYSVFSGKNYHWTNSGFKISRISGPQ